MAATDQTGTAETPISLESAVSRLGDLPTLAPVAMEVLRLADDENSSMNDIAKAISTDPGLTVRLLRLANSAAYSRGKEITNLNVAAMLLGMQTLKMVTLGFTLVADMDPGELDTSIVWRRGLASAVLARHFASNIDPDLVDDAFVAGLLSNVGKLALAEEPAYVAAVQENGPWLRPAQEERMFGLTSDEVTAEILKGWGLPNVLVDAVRHRNAPSGDENKGELASVLQVSDDAARLILAEDDSDRANALDSLTTSAATNLGMTIGQVEVAIQELGSELDEIAKSFDLEAINHTPVDELVRSAQTHLTRLSLDLATQLSAEQERNENLTELNRQLEEEAATDALTGLPNRRTFSAYMDNQVAGRVRKQRSTVLALVMFDLDHFKSINDNFGHSIGDEVLQEFGRRLKDGSRRGELAARVGGEEFAVIMPDIVPQELEGAAERLRTLIGDEPVDTSMGPLAVTASIGASFTVVTSADAAAQLYAAADEALYASKHAGRDRVTVKPLDG